MILRLLLATVAWLCLSACACHKPLGVTDSGASMVANTSAQAEAAK